MKMKNMLIGGMSLALVACISIGGTLAYLTDKTGPVTNTFIASAGIAMTLDEAKVELNNDKTAYVEDTDYTGGIGGTNRVTENRYANILSDVKQDKDPTVHVTSVPAAGAEVYICVKGLDDVDGKYTVETYYDESNTINPIWQPVKGYTNLYKYNGLVTMEMITAAKGSLDVQVFNHITYSWNNDVTKVQGFNPNNFFAPVTVQAYAVQAGVSSAATDAAGALGATATTPDPTPAA